MNQGGKQMSAEKNAETLKSVNALLNQQIERVEQVRNSRGRIQYDHLDRIVIGLVGGDGIGPAITRAAESVLRRLLDADVKKGRIEFKTISGLTLENRLKHLKAIPDDVLEEIKKCNVILKGPTTTPEKGDGMPNIESANVRMRKELDLFANVRPIKVASQNIDWVFFRENTEDLYALGSQGLMVTPDIALDFRVISRPCSERIIRAAFEYAKQNNKTLVSVVTKANVVKTTDGLFLDVAKEIAKDYPGIETDAWYIDIMTANLINRQRRSRFQVMVMPNLYGDILTDEAGEIQGGVGTAGAANIGDRYAMFEAIHGSAPRMFKEKREQYANPSSMLVAASMLLRHIGYQNLGARLDMALDICAKYERKLKITGRADGATGAEYGEYVLSVVAEPDLQDRWNEYEKQTQREDL